MIAPKKHDISNVYPHNFQKLANIPAFEKQHTMIAATTITTSNQLFKTFPTTAKQIDDENEETATIATSFSDSSRSNVSLSDHDDYGDDDDIYDPVVEFEVSLVDIEHQKYYANSKNIKRYTKQATPEKRELLLDNLYDFQRMLSFDLILWQGR